MARDDLSPSLTSSRAERGRSQSSGRQNLGIFSRIRRAFSRFRRAPPSPVPSVTPDGLVRRLPSRPRVRLPTPPPLQRIPSWPLSNSEAPSLAQLHASANRRHGEADQSHAGDSPLLQPYVAENGASQGPNANVPNSTNMNSFVVRAPQRRRHRSRTHHQHLPNGTGTGSGSGHHRSHNNNNNSNGVALHITDSGLDGILVPASSSAAAGDPTGAPPTSPRLPHLPASRTHSAHSPPLSRPQLARVLHRHHSRLLRTRALRDKLLMLGIIQILCGLASETLASVSLINDPMSAAAAAQGLGPNSPPARRSGGYVSGAGAMVPQSPSSTAHLNGGVDAPSGDTSTSAGDSLLVPLPDPRESSPGAGTTLPRPSSTVHERGTGSRHNAQPQLQQQQPSRNAQSNLRFEEEYARLSSKQSRPQSPENAFAWFLRVSFVCGLVYLVAGAFGIACSRWPTRTSMLHGFLYLSFAAAVVSLSQAFVSALSIFYLSALQSAHSASLTPRPPATPPGYSGHGPGLGNGTPRKVDLDRFNQFTSVSSGRPQVNYKVDSAYGSSQDSSKTRVGSNAASSSQRSQRLLEPSSSNEMPDLSATSPFAPSHSGIYQNLIVYILLLVVSIMQSLCAVIAMYTVSGVVCCSSRFLSSPFGLCLYRLCPCPLLLRSYRHDRYSRVARRSLYLTAEELPPRAAALLSSSSSSSSSWWRFWSSSFWSGDSSRRRRIVHAFLQDSVFNNASQPPESGAERLFEMYNERVLSQVGTDNVLLRVFPSMPAGSEVSNPPAGSARQATATATTSFDAATTTAIASASDPIGSALNGHMSNSGSGGSPQVETTSLGDRNELQVGPPDPQPDHLVLLMPLSAGVAGSAAGAGAGAGGRRRPHHRSRSSHRSLASRLLRSHRRRNASATSTGEAAAPARPVEIQGLLFPRPPPPYTPGQSQSDFAPAARSAFGVGPVALNDLSNPPPTDTQSSFSQSVDASSEQIYDYLNNLSTSSLRERERDRRLLGGAQLQGARRPAAIGSSMALALEGRRAPSPPTSTSARPASFLCAGHERRGHSSSSRLALASSAAAGQQQLAAADSLSQIAPPSYSTIDLSAVPLVATRARTPSPPPTPPATRAHANNRHAEPAPHSSFVCALVPVPPQDAYPSPLLTSLASYTSRRPPTPLAHARPLNSAAPDSSATPAVANAAARLAILAIGGGVAFPGALASSSSEAESVHVPYRLLLSYAHGAARPHSDCIDRTSAAVASAREQRASEGPVAHAQGTGGRAAGGRPSAPLPDSHSSTAIGSSSYCSCYSPACATASSSSTQLHH